jgi:hypothetical protein
MIIMDQRNWIERLEAQIGLNRQITKKVPDDLDQFASKCHP